MVWNLADIIDATARVVPGDRPALIQDGQVTTWADFDARTNRLARAWQALGLAPGDTVALICRNHPAYLEGFTAALKARLVPVNINYRYRADEATYVCRDAQVRAVLYQSEFIELAQALREALPPETLWICLDAAADADGVLSFEAQASSGDGSPLDIVRSPEDSLLLYTGGTTGMPKGVIWPTGKYRAAQLNSPLVKSPPQNLQEHVALVQATANPGRTLPACPLMHGTALNGAMAELLNGGTAVIMPAARFDAHALWALVERERVTRVLIVGDAFARPMLAALEEAPGRYDLSSLKVISSAGLMWSLENKQGLLRHVPQAVMFDALGASEASGMGYTVTTLDQQLPTGRFLPGRRVALLTDEGELLLPGTPGIGMLAQAEPLPAGYLGDPAKTASVFKIINGERYSIPGDYAERHADGTMSLIGRGSLVINTGGEKVYVEEVEEAVKRLPGVLDALVVGVPHPQFGSQVAALVQLAPDTAVTPQAWRDQLDVLIAAYKVPRHFVVQPAVPRGENGKANYKLAREQALTALATTLA